MRQQTFRLEGHLPGERARSDPYVYLPFSVPAGARRIHVAYDYTEPAMAPMGPGNAVDIGIFDSRG
ncbi:MAG: CehA/McbA family metallohydrolase, partial [Thermoanaerobaculia bacterium]